MESLYRNIASTPNVPIFTLPLIDLPFICINTLIVKHTNINYISSLVRQAV